MSLVRQIIKNLVSGISQQPPTLRSAEQLEEQLNCLSSEAGGLQKRPPTIQVARLDEAALTTGTPFCHFIDNGGGERYCVVIPGNGQIYVWDMQGNSLTVTFAANASTYATATSPRYHLKAVTIADYTFLLNMEKTVAMTGETTSNVWATQGALVNVKSGQYGRTYSIVVDGVQKATFETPDGSNASHTKQIDTDYIAAQLKVGLEATGYTVTLGESWLYFTGNFTTIETKDGYGNQAMRAVYKHAQKFTDLPASAPNGFLVEITGESGSNADNYYLVYSASDKVWRETAKPGILNTFDASTLPHVLIRNADGTFTFRPAEWVKRMRGDDDSNPLPSFEGNPVNDLFFFMNRLGLISGENVVLTKTSDFFQFWIASATDVVDTDPIDVAVSHNEDSTLYHAVPFNRSLLLFSKSVQFVAEQTGVLSPKTFAPQQTTEFNGSVKVRPVAAGRNIYFISERALYATLKEYYLVEDSTDTRNAQDISSHVPNLIPNGVYRILSSTNENLMFVLTEGAPGSIFVYKYLFQDEQRIQSSWSEWKLTGGAEILGGTIQDSSLSLLIRRGSFVTIERMDFTYNNVDFTFEPYRVFLDRKIAIGPIPATDYIEYTDKTKINVNALYGGGGIPEDTYGIVLQDGFYTTFTPADLTNGVLLLDGNHAGKSGVIGHQYTARIKLSTLILRQDTGNGLRAVTDGTLYVSSFSLDYGNSGYFKILVEHLANDTYEHEMTARILGDAENLIGTVPQIMGTLTVPVHGKNDKVKISVESPYPVPLALISAAWTGNYHRRSKQI